jgi:hypothetical protein
MPPPDAAGRPAARKGPAKKAPARTSPAKKATKKTPAKKAAKKTPAKKAAKTPAKAAAPVARRRPDKRPTPPRRTAAALVVPAGERAHVLAVPWEERKLAGYAGARWRADVGAWVWVGVALPPRLEGYASAPYSPERWLEDDLNVGVPDVAPAHLQAPPTAAVVLHPHQVEAAEAVAAAHDDDRPGFVLADDVGLGKTYAVLEGVRRIAPRRVLVLCPLAVVPHWRRSIAALGGGETRWLVTNYDRAKALLDAPASAAAAKRARTRNKRVATKGRSRVAWDVVVYDESHLLRNPTSQRSAAARRLAGEGEDWQAFRLWLSATAGQNPLHLAYLAPVLAAATGARVRDLADFEQWAAAEGLAVRRGPFGSWVWERNDADLARMRDLLFGGPRPAGLRRRPEDLAGWPTQQRIAYPVDLTRRDRQLYEAAWTRFRNDLELARRGGDPQSALVAQLRFRQKASLLRTADTAALVGDLVANGLQVAVSVQFLETLDAIVGDLEAAGVGVVAISGAVGADDREDARLAFQRGDADVVVFTPTEGFSLHAGEQLAGATDTPRVTVVHDCRYSALDAKQIEGRAHRDGQSAVCYYLYAADTVEEVVVGRTIDRLADMGTMLGDDVGWAAELAAAVDGYPARGG